MPAAWRLAAAATYRLTAPSWDVLYAEGARKSELAYGPVEALRRTLWCLARECAKFGVLEYRHEGIPIRSYVPASSLVKERKRCRDFGP